MALSGDERRELDNLETAQRIYGFLTPDQQRRLKELQDKRDAGGMSPEAQQVYGPAVAPDTGGAEFLQWAAANGLTGEDFGATPAPGRFLQWAMAHGLTAEDFQTEGGGGGGQPATGGGAAAPAPMGDAEIRARIDELGFGWLANDPDVGPLLIALAKGEIDQTTFNGRLRQTKWWSQHSEAVRQWDTLVHTDPATAQARRAGMAAQITNAARSLGLDDAGFVNTLTERALRFGLNAEQIQDQLAGEVDFNKVRFGGAASAIQRVRQLEGDYITPLSMHTRRNMARRVISGELDDAGLQAFFVNQARSVFANNDDVASALDRGLTVRDFASPYIELAARELGVNPNSIDLLDRRWRRALHSRTPEGRPGAMSLDEWTSTLRTDDTYGYDRSVNGRTAAAQFRTEFEKMMGVGA